MTTPFDPGQKQHREEMHGHGHNGMYVYRYRWVDFPRLTMMIHRKSRNDPETRTWFVDGKEVERSQEAVLAALEQPHDIAGATQRLQDRSIGRTVSLAADGVLEVRGESARRCALLKVRFPEFEGIPILWIDTGAIDDAP